MQQATSQGAECQPTGANPAEEQEAQVSAGLHSAAPETNRWISATPRSPARADTLPHPVQLPAARVPEIAPPDAETVARACPFEITWVTGLAELEALREDWRMLETASCQPVFFQGHAWVTAWARQFFDESRPGHALSIATVRRAGALIAVLPLVLQRQRAGTYLVGLGEPLSQYDDLLIAADAPAGPVVSALWQSIRAMPGIDGMRLRRVRETSPLARFLPGDIRAGCEDAAPALALDGFRGDASLYRAEQSSSARKRLKRYEKSLGKQGCVRFEVERGGAAAARRTRLALQLKAEWLREKGMTSRMFVTPWAQEALIALAADPDGNIWVGTLSVDGQPVAIEVGLLDNGHLGSFLGAFDLRWQNHRPGQIQLHMSICWAIENGVATYDLLPPDADYKRRLASHAIRVHDYSAALSLRGWLGLRLWQGCLRTRFKQAFYRLPTTLRTAALALSGR